MKDNIGSSVIVYSTPSPCSSLKHILYLLHVFRSPLRPTRRREHDFPLAPLPPAQNAPHPPLLRHADACERGLIPRRRGGSKRGRRRFTQVPTRCASRHKRGGWRSRRKKRTRWRRRRNAVSEKGAIVIAVVVVVVVVVRGDRWRHRRYRPTAARRASTR